VQGIYGIHNTVTGDWYVGQSAQVQQRWGAHLTALEAGKHVSTALQAAWREHGPSAFEFAVLEVLPDTGPVDGVGALLDREAAWIAKLQPAYNTAGTPRHGIRIREAGRRAPAPRPPAEHHGYISFQMRVGNIGDLIRGANFLESIPDEQLLAMRCLCCGGPIFQAH
jgi:hypothetical protein